MTVSRSLRFVDAAEAERLLDYRLLVDRLRDGFLSPPIAPERTILPLGDRDAVMLVMPVARPGGLAGIKLATVHPALANRPGGAVRALCLAVDAATGDPLAVIDGDAVTRRRTAAVSVLAALTLARPDSDSVLIVGTGQIARALCECYATFFAPRKLRVWGRRADAARDFAKDMAGQRISVEPVSDLAAAVNQADIVSTATLAQRPLVLGAQVRPGTHVDLVGGFTPVMREADDQLTGSAILVVDGPGVIDSAGDIAGPVARGIVDRSEIRLLGEVLAGCSTGRTSAEGITLFKSVGHALEDLVAMEMIVAGMAR